MYISDDDSNAADIYPLTGPNQQQLGSISTGIKYPWGLSVDSNNSLYVANAGNGTVTVYPYGSSTPSMTYSHGLTGPLYALADSAGHVFVSGLNRRHGWHLVEYNAGTNVPIAHRRLAQEADGMALDAQGNLYVAYRLRTGTSTIAEFGPGLTNKRLLGMSIDQPQGLLVDSSDNIVVVQSAARNIEVFPPGATTPSVTVSFATGYSNLAQLAWQNNQTTLWVSTERGYVYSMPYPLTPSTIPTEYDQDASGSNGIAVTPSVSEQLRTTR